MTFKGIFEISPVDFLGINSKGVVGNIIAGMCDGDVSDLEGIDRMTGTFCHGSNRRNCRNPRLWCGAPTTISSIPSGRSVTAPF